jgi:membrane associated rhomboid family serine protease
MATCYRHPSRETGVSCSNCGRPICPDCMTPTPVGMRCPECAKQRTKVRTARTMTSDPYATYVLMAVNILAFFGSAAGGSGIGSGGGGNVFRDGALFGPAIDINNEYWRLVTSGFLHSGILHLAFNMYVLYWLGTMMEPALGRPKFLALYFTSLLAGSFGALLVEPNALTVGASGAVFGLMGGAFVTQRLRGIDPMQSGIGPIILLNLALTFFISNISIGGHIGGLVGGAIAAFALERLSQGRRSEIVPLLACLVIAVVAVAGAIAVAGRETDEFAALLLFNGS